MEKVVVIALVRRMTAGLTICLTVGLLSSCSSAPRTGESAASPAKGPSVGAPPSDVDSNSGDSDTNIQDGAAEAKPEPELEAPMERPSPSSVRGHSLDERYETLAKAVRVSGKAGQVQEEAARLLGTNPNDPVALNTVALLYLRRGKPKAAKLLLSRALEKNPPTAALHNNLGVAILEDGDQEAAVLEFKKALELDDGHVEALGNLGSIYAKGGDYERAFLYLEASYRANRANAAVANNYALALKEKKEYEAARRVYDDLLKMHPKDTTALLNCAILLIDFMNKPKDGLDLVFKLKFHETRRKDVLARANALEKKAKSELK